MPGPFLAVQPRRANSLQGPGELCPDLAFGYHNGWLYDSTVGRRTSQRLSLAGGFFPSSQGPFEKISNKAFAAPGPTDIWVRPGGATVTIRFMISDLSTFHPLLFKGVSTSRHWTLSVYPDGQIRMETNGYFGGSSGLQSAAGTIEAGKWYTLTMVGGSASNHQMWLDGRLVATSSLGMFPSVSDAPDSLRVGFGLSFSGNFVSAANLSVSHISVAYTNLSVGRIRELAHNPSSMFQKPKRNLDCLPDTYGAITVPGADVSTSGWVATPGPSFTPMVNEFIADDGSYIVSPFAGTGAPIILELGRSLPAGQWNVRFRANYIGSFASSVVVRLLNSSNVVVGTAAAELLTVGMQTHTVAVDTTGEASRISIEAV